MTALLEKAIKKAQKLTDAEQNAIAMIILEELEDEARWEKAFSKSHELLARLAEEAMEADANIGDSICLPKNLRQTHRNA